MKTLIMLLLAVLLSNTVKGQDRPVVVDNSKYFPPYQYQGSIDCSHVALIYYLKSSLWNREFNRNPKLKENQFSNSFVWDQNVDEEMSLFSIFTAAVFMENQGCATVADFPISKQGSSIKPSMEVREKAMSYKTSQLKTMQPPYIQGGTSEESFKLFLQNLKDSLVKGCGFVVNFPIFPELSQVKNGGVYNYKDDYPNAFYSVRHVVAITGYNDTIKTANGRGAFQAINSWEELEFFYLDYSWFSGSGLLRTAYFLEENFNSERIKVSLSLNLDSSLHNKNYYSGDNYRFVNGLVQDDFGKDFDFLGYLDIWHHKSLIQITKLNGKNLSYDQRILLTVKSDHGEYQVVSDISDLFFDDSCKSLEVTVFDPISSEFIDENNNIIYSFTREPKTVIGMPLIHFVDSNFRIIGLVKNVSDTTMVFENYLSRQMVAYAKDPANASAHNGAFIKQSRSLLSRQTITFSRADLKSNSAPTIINAFDSVFVYVDSTFNFQFKAVDTDNDNIVFSIVAGSGASIDKQTGLFHYVPSSTGTKQFTVEVSDGKDSSSYHFEITSSIFIKPNSAPTITNAFDSVFVYVDSTFNFQFKALDTDNDNIVFSIVAGSGASIDKQTGLFHYVPNSTGTKQFTVEVSDGKDFSSYHFEVTSSIFIKPNSAPTIINAFDSVFVYVDSTFNFQFKAVDTDNDNIVFSIVAGSGASIDKQTGLFHYVPSSTGTKQFTVEVSDGKDFSRYEFKITSDRFVSASSIRNAESHKMIVYPNPCRDIVNFELSSLNNSHVKIEIFDLSGRLITVPLNREVSSNEQNVHYDSSFLKTGIYICRLTSEGKFLQSVKLIKN